MSRKVSGGARARAGPAESQAEVLELFTGQGGALYRFCRAMLGSPADAEDVVQDAFLKLVLHLERGGDRSNLRAWLFAVAANGCRDRIRARRRWLPWTPAADLRATEADDISPDRRAAVAALRTLPPRERLLLGLRAQGFSYREIAAAAGVREQSIGTLLARAARRWKRSLAAAAGAAGPNARR